jgi:acetyl esterase/lipase
MPIFFRWTLLLLLVVPIQTFSYEIKVSRHVYGKEAPKAQVIDAHLLVRDKPTPVLVEIISAAWFSSVPEKLVSGLYDRYHDIGFSVISVNHRNIDSGISWSDIGNDVSRAIQFIRHHAAEWNIDPDRISIEGGSAGGHIAMMIGFEEDRSDPKSDDPIKRQSSAIRCVIEWAGPTDLATQHRNLFSDEEFIKKNGGFSRRIMLMLTGMKQENFGTEQFYRRLYQISPIRLVNKDTVPVLILCRGPRDIKSINDPRLKWDIHTPISGLMLAKKLKQFGVEHEIEIIPDLSEESELTMKVISEFLKKHNNIP